MTQPTEPETFNTGDVKREPHGRAIAVRLKGGLAGWIVVSVDQGMRIAAEWEADFIATWPDVDLPDQAAPADAGTQPKKTRAR